MEKYIDEVATIRSQRAVIAKVALLLAVIGMYGYLSWQVSGSEFALLEQVKNPGFALGNCTAGLKIIENSTDREEFIDRCRVEFKNQLLVAQSGEVFVRYVGWIVPVTYQAQEGYFTAAVDSIQFQAWVFETYVKADVKPYASTKMCSDYQPRIQVIWFREEDVGNMSSTLKFKSEIEGYGIKDSYRVKEILMSHGVPMEKMVWYEVFILQKYVTVTKAC